MHGHLPIDSVPSQYLVDYVNVQSANENGPYYLLDEIQIRDRRVFSVVLTMVILAVESKPLCPRKFCSFFSQHWSTRRTVSLMKKIVFSEGKNVTEPDPENKKNRYLWT